MDPVYAGLSTKRSGAHGIFLVSVRMVPVDRTSVDRVFPFSIFFYFNFLRHRFVRVIALQWTVTICGVTFFGQIKPLVSELKYK